jgi:hypothetical protein
MTVKTLKVKTTLMPITVSRSVESRGALLQNTRTSMQPAIREPKKSTQKEISTSLNQPEG